jgi:hypothetical protein
VEAVAQRPALGRLQASAVRGSGWRKALLGCGVAATALFIGTDALAARRYEGYSYKSQTISELSAVDAPTGWLWTPVGFSYGVLMLLFAAGVWLASGPGRALRVVAGLVAAIGITGILAWPFAPMHRREVLAAGGATFSDTLHIVLATVDSLCFMLSMAIGASALGARFRRYSVATIVTAGAFGALTGPQAPKVQHNEPTPWIGVTERIMIFGSMLWYAVLAIGLMRRKEPPASEAV